MLHDVNANLGRNTPELYVHFIGTFDGREFILFRDVDPWKGFTKPVKTKYKWDESSGLVWMWSDDFYAMQYNKDRSTGWSRFSYPEGTRRGVNCNDIYKDQK
jgi:hypothetical protein